MILILNHIQVHEIESVVECMDSRENDDVLEHIDLQAEEQTENVVTREENTSLPVTLFLLFLFTAVVVFLFLFVSH